MHDEPAVFLQSLTKLKYRVKSECSVDRYPRSDFDRIMYSHV